MQISRSRTFQTARNMMVVNAEAVRALESHFPGFTKRVLVPGASSAHLPPRIVNQVIRNLHERNGRPTHKFIVGKMVRDRGLNGLGFSLKPPRWLRNIFSGSTITASNKGVNIVTQPLDVPLPGGGTLTTQSLPQRAAEVVENIPGGWGTVAAVGAVGVILLVKLFKR